MKTFVVDFDGTLVRCNSFPRWITFALRNALKSLKFGIVFKIVSLLARRKLLKSISHFTLKQQIDAINYPEDWGKRFVHKLKSNRSNSVLNFVTQQINPANQIFISTAAPRCYAQFIPEIFFPDSSIECLSSTKLDDQTYFNNFKKNKADRIKELTSDNDEITLLTDHTDYFELAKISKEVYLCNPTQKHLNFYQKSTLPFTLMEDR